jgi:hypothetical protein
MEEEKDHVFPVTCVLLSSYRTIKWCAFTHFSQLKLEIYGAFEFILYDSDFLFPGWTTHMFTVFHIDQRLSNCGARPPGWQSFGRRELFV